ncbi:MAG: DUF4876 domain-containing protein [Prevotellaceae bacterium]|jgi:hypothetical protein|nr:DUF4876 domain-containing protein [Prevotellaceae bacterium]
MNIKKSSGIKSLLLVMLFALPFIYSCKDKEDEGVKTFSLKIQLVYPGELESVAGVKVKLQNTITDDLTEANTDSDGLAEFTVIAGTYDASTSETRSVGRDFILLNGVKTSIIVSDSWTGTPVNLNLAETKTSQLVIKEVYTGGCQKDDGSGAFQRDPYIILYNNSNQAVSLNNLCFAMVNPYNSNVATNNDYVNGELLYASEGWIPAGTGIWTFRQAVSLDPGKQIVIAVNNAIDNTLTYNNSINFANPDYYCMYDIDIYPNTTYYPAPSEIIPTSHYLKAYHWGAGNAWPLSVNSPAFFIFTPEGVTPENFVADADRNNNYNNSTSASNLRKKVPVGWIVDAIEVYTKGNANNKKRFTPTIDAGYTELTNSQGYTLYRNVNKEATESIAENTGKIVYNYSHGTANDEINGTTDPSGIDAEASIKNGAHIIYKDTNNSSDDFHQRNRASLRGE